MKTKIYQFVLILSSVLCTVNSYSQAPQAIPYQAVARNNNGNVIADQNISLRFSIHDAIAAGTIVYQETQSATTNALGLFSVNIGQGIVITGTFNNIDWGGGSKFVQVELDTAGGISYTDMGTQQMLSVPYALYSGYSGNGNFWNANGNDIYNTNSGRIGIGTTTPGTVANTTARVEIADSNGLNSDLLIRTAHGGVPSITLANSNGTLSSPAAQYDLNWTGVINSYYYNGTSFGEGSRILMSADSISPGYFPGNIGFFTAPKSDTNLVERMTIKSNGNVGIGTTLPDDKLSIGDFSSPSDEYLSLKTSGGNQYKAGIKLMHFNTSVGWVLESDEVTSSFKIHHLNTDNVPFKINFYGHLILGDSVWNIQDAASRLLIGNKTTSSILRLGESETNFLSIGWIKLTDDSSMSYSHVGSYGGNPLVLQRDSGNVGIGTTTPVSKLHIVSKQTGITLDDTDDSTRVAFWAPDPTGGGTGGIGTITNHNFPIFTNNTDRMTITSDGKVGIGTTTPSYTVDIGADPGTDVLRVRRISLPNDVITLKSEIGNEGTFQLFNDGLLGVRLTASGNSYFKYGNFGIGTPSPAAKLDVAGDINSTSGYKINGTASAGNYLRGDGNNFVASTIQPTDIPFRATSNDLSGSSFVIGNQNNNNLLYENHSLSIASDLLPGFSCDFIYYSTNTGSITASSAILFSKGSNTAVSSIDIAQGDHIRIQAFDPTHVFVTVY